MIFSENFLSVEIFLEWKWALRGEDEKLSYYMFPLPHFTLRLQVVAVRLRSHLWMSIISTSKYWLNWFLFAFKVYKHAKLQILIATDKSGNQATKTYDGMIWNICPFILAGFERAQFHFTRVRLCSASGSDIYILIIRHWNVVIWKRYKLCIDLLVKQRSQI
jgi:hypothetical protein